MLKKPNPKLALAIPTYNRSSILQENLKQMLPEIREHWVAVYISDDSTDAATEQAIAEFRNEYEFIFYRRNEPSFGHDGNFFATVAMPAAEYVWYLGDSLYFVPGALTHVLSLLERDLDFVFLNSYAPDSTDRIIAGADVKQFLVDRAWYLTLSGATIYGAKPRALHIAEDRKKQWKNFPQLGTILEYASLCPTSCAWVGRSAISFNKKRRVTGCERR